MNYAYVAAALALALTAGAGAWLLRGGRDRLGFALLVAAPVVAGATLAGVQQVALPTSAAPSAPGANPHAGVDMSAAASGTTSTPSADRGVGTSSAIDGARQRAEQLRIARRFAEARVAYTELTRLAPDDADAWADLADASAAAAGGDLEQSVEALAKALALDPEHRKALWLQATLELQRKRYGEAAALWEKLLGLVPAGGNDARIVAANLEEARALQRGER